MTRLMFRYVIKKKNVQEGFQPLFLYFPGKVRVGAFMKNTYPVFRPKQGNVSINFFLQFNQKL
jgi:hypothetical protein